MRNLGFLGGLGVVIWSLSTSALANPVTIQSVLFDHDGDVLTVGPAAIDSTGNPVQNGSFLIYRDLDAVDLPVGNGVDDRTSGLFDFRGDNLYAPFVAALTSGAHISAARLQLVLTVADPLYTNDQFSLENGTYLGEPEVGDQLSANAYLANGVSKLVTIDLLKYYTGEQLYNFLSLGSGDFFNDGRIVLRYGDDATVSGAALTLTAVPEPGSLALVGLGAALLPWIGRRRGRPQPD